MAMKPMVTLTAGELKIQGGLLRERSTPVALDDKGLATIIQDLRDTLYASKISVGLSGVQIGLTKRVFVMNVEKSDRSREVVCVNPRLLESHGSTIEKNESCMSVINSRGSVKRKEKVTLAYFDANGNAVTREFVGFEARVVQHELDHLDGVLFADRLENIDKLEEFNFYTLENYPLQAR